MAPTETPTDIVVVLPGIMGSALEKDGKPVWSVSAGALLQAILHFGRNVAKLQLPDGIGDEHPGDGVKAVSMLGDLHVIPGLWTPVKGYDQTVSYLQGLGYRLPTPDRPGNLVLFPYDWRLSNRYNGRELKKTVESAMSRWRDQGGEYADARASFVVHSMGGLVARWYIEQEGGHEVTRKLITLGTPYRGALGALEKLAEGLPLKVGPITALNLTGFVRSLPSLHQLLPEYACISDGTGQLKKTTEMQLPDFSTAMVADAMAFHESLKAAEAARPASLEMTHAIVGIKQPTGTTASFDGSAWKYWQNYNDDNLFGDATVPLVGAVRADVKLDSPLLRRIADQHGNLQCNKAALEEVEGVLTAKDVLVRGLEIEAQVSAPELIVAGEVLDVAVDIEGNRQPTVTVRDEHGAAVATRVPKPRRGHAEAKFDDLTPGGYTVEVTGPPTGLPVSKVVSTVLVWDPAADAKLV